jgi:hypothetical protein
VLRPRLYHAGHLGSISGYDPIVEGERASPTGTLRIGSPSMAHSPAQSTAAASTSSTPHLLPVSAGGLRLIRRGADGEREGWCWHHPSRTYVRGSGLSGRRAFPGATCRAKSCYRSRAVTYAITSANVSACTAMGSAWTISTARARTNRGASLATFVAGAGAFSRRDAIAVGTRLTRTGGQVACPWRAANADTILTADQVIGLRRVAQFERRRHERGHVGQLRAGLDYGPTSSLCIDTVDKLIQRHASTPSAEPRRVAIDSPTTIFWVDAQSFRG